MGCIDLEIAAAAVSLSFALSRFSHRRPFLFYVATDGVTTQQLFLRKKEAVVVTRERDTWSSECSLKESALSDNRGSESYSASASCTAAGAAAPRGGNQLHSN